MRALTRRPLTLGFGVPGLIPRSEVLRRIPGKTGTRVLEDTIFCDFPFLTENLMCFGSKTENPKKERPLHQKTQVL